MFLKTKVAPEAQTTQVNQTINKKGAPSVISHGLHILGNIVSDGAVDIDGSVNGNIKGEQVSIRANGKISGDIIAQSVFIYGEVRGLIRAEVVHLYSTCNVSGIIVHKSMVVEDGAFIDAKFKRMDAADSSEQTSMESQETEDGFLESAPSFVGNGTLRLIG